MFGNGQKKKITESSKKPVIDVKSVRNVRKKIRSSMSMILKFLLESTTNDEYVEKCLLSGFSFELSYNPASRSPIDNYFYFHADEDLEDLEDFLEKFGPFPDDEKMIIRRLLLRSLFQKRIDFREELNIWKNFKKEISQRVQK